MVSVDVSFYPGLSDGDGLTTVVTTDRRALVQERQDDLSLTEGSSFRFWQSQAPP